VAIVSRENSEHYRWGGGCDGWHLLKSSGLSVIEERVPPGASEVNHYHATAQQFFYILCGEATVEFEQRRVRLGPQQGIAVPPRTAHRLCNESDSELRFLVISSPPSHGDRVVVA
jgi:mannose-6-phosphate isomerase-like protein (cupin superfamily)